MDDEVQNIFLDSVKIFEQLNWDIEDVKIKTKLIEWAYSMHAACGAAFDFQHDYKESFDDLCNYVTPVIELGLNSTALGLGKAQKVRKQLQETMYQFFKNFDILVTPTLPIPAFKPVWLEHGVEYPKAGKKALNAASIARFTYPFNLTGHPAASIPCGWTKSGLPVGLHIVGRRYDEKTVLQVSKAFEEISPWQDKRPKFD